MNEELQTGKAGTTCETCAAAESVWQGLDLVSITRSHWKKSVALAIKMLPPDLKCIIGFGKPSSNTILITVAADNIPEDPDDYRETEIRRITVRLFDVEDEQELERFVFDEPAYFPLICVESSTLDGGTFLEVESDSAAELIMAVQTAILEEFFEGTDMVWKDEEGRYLYNGNIILDWQK